jgi:molybdenum cofactor biosynthesis enzyme
VIVRVIIIAAVEVVSRVKVTDQAGASSEAFKALSIAASASY